MEIDAIAAITNCIVHFDTTRASKLYHMADLTLHRAPIWIFPPFVFEFSTKMQSVDSIHGPLDNEFSTLPLRHYVSCNLSQNITKWWKLKNKWRENSNWSAVKGQICYMIQFAGSRKARVGSNVGCNLNAIIPLNRSKCCASYKR